VWWSCLVEWCFGNCVPTTIWAKCLFKAGTGKPFRLAMLGSRLGGCVLVGCARDPTWTLKSTILTHLVYKGKILNSAQNNNRPSDTSSSRPKQLTRHIKKAAKVKTTEWITESVRHMYLLWNSMKKTVRDNILPAPLK